MTIWLQPKLACHKTIAFIRLIYHGGKLNLLLLVRAWLIKIQSAVSSGRLVIIHTGFTHFGPDRKPLWGYLPDLNCLNKGSKKKRWREGLRWQMRE